MLLNEKLGIKFPIVQGAMANIATAEFAAAVSNEGGLGIIGTGAMTPDLVRASIEKCRTLTDKPFGVNVMLMNPHSDDIFEVIYELKPAVVTTGAGNPGKYMAKLKELGIMIIPIIPTVALAIRMERAGADMVIAEGTEAGGHVGELTTMALIPQVVDALSIPVIAAGGIADGRGFNAALSLGAIGIQLGTVLLAAKECPIHENYRQAIISSKDTDTVVTGRSLGAPVRIKKNKMSNEYLKLEKSGADREDFERLTLGSLRRAVFEGDMDTGSVMMGQIAGLVKEKTTLRQIFESMTAQSLVEFKHLETKLKDIK